MLTLHIIYLTAEMGGNPSRSRESENTDKFGLVEVAIYLELSHQDGASINLFHGILCLL